ncbi:hypothetical protein M2341_001776 [Sphingobium sp. B7D2B]|nr:hypothetical protein [Sphingobium sp. B7D2B]
MKRQLLGDLSAKVVISPFRRKLPPLPVMMVQGRLA